MRLAAAAYSAGSRRRRRFRSSGSRKRCSIADKFACIGSNSGAQDGASEPLSSLEALRRTNDHRWLGTVSCAGALASLFREQESSPMFIQTEVTPNPATLKFLPGRPVMDEGTFEARDEAQAERSPLAKALMQLPGVGGVFFANDFISVTKTDGEWQHLRPQVLGVVTEFYLSG